MAEPKIEISRVDGAWEVDVTLKDYDAFRITFHDDGTTDMFRVTWAELCKVAWGVVDAIKHPTHSRN